MVALPSAFHVPPPHPSLRAPAKQSGGRAACRGGSRTARSSPSPLILSLAEGSYPRRREPRRESGDTVGATLVVALPAIPAPPIVIASPSEAIWRLGCGHSEQSEESSTIAKLGSPARLPGGGVAGPNAEGDRLSACAPKIAQSSFLPRSSIRPRVDDVKPTPFKTVHVTGYN